MKLYWAVFLNQNLTPTAMIEMLEHFLLAAPIVTTDLHTRSGIVKEYFVPHMLQHHLLSKSHVAQAQSSSLKNASPFHLTFLSGYVPPGSLCSTSHFSCLKERCYSSLSSWNLS